MLVTYECQSLPVLNILSHFRNQMMVKFKPFSDFNMINHARILYLVQGFHIGVLPSAKQLTWKKELIVIHMYIFEIYLPFDHHLDHFDTFLSPYAIHDDLDCIWSDNCPRYLALQIGHFLAWWWTERPRLFGNWECSRQILLNTIQPYFHPIWPETLMTHLANLPHLLGTFDHTRPKHQDSKPKFTLWILTSRINLTSV